MTVQFSPVQVTADQTLTSGSRTVVLTRTISITLLMDEDMDFLAESLDLLTLCFHSFKVSVTGGFLSSRAEDIYGSVLHMMLNIKKKKKQPDNRL